MSLGRLQKEFTLAIAEFIIWAYSEGYLLTFGDAYRDHRLHGNMGEKKAYGHKNSNHKKRLAVDFNAFLNGDYLTKPEDYKFLGEKWETIHPLARWGGRFNDGNHFSFKHNGTM